MIYIKIRFKTTLIKDKLIIVSISHKQEIQLGESRLSLKINYLVEHCKKNNIDILPPVTQPRYKDKGTTYKKWKFF